MRSEQQRSQQQRSRGQTEESKPGEQTDAEAEHVVGDRRQVRSLGGRQGGQFRGRQGRQQKSRQLMNAGKSCIDAVEQSGKGESAGGAYMQG